MVSLKRCPLVAGVFVALAMASASLAASPVAESSREDSTEAAAWLDRLAESAQTFSYQGVVVYARGAEQLDTLRITHGEAEGELYERLEYLDDGERELVLQGQRLTRAAAGHPRATSIPGVRLPMQGADELAVHYQASVVGTGRVASRPTVELALVPRDPYRYGYFFSLDRDTGLLLRSEVVDNERRVLERLQFSMIEVQQQLKDEWVTGAVQPVSAVTETDGDTPVAAVDNSPGPLQPGWLPDGFELMSGTPSDPHMRSYSDGLAVLSLIVQHEQGAPQQTGSARRGATVAFTRGVAVEGRNYTVTVIGEVPLATAQRVAESVVARDTADRPS